MKTTLSVLLALAITTLPAMAQAKSLSLLSKPETTATIVAAVKSGDRLIPIFAPEKSDWIKVADPSNGNVGWLKRQDLGLNTQPPQLYKKNFERESGNKNSGPYRHERYEYQGTEKLSEDQIKNIFDNMEKQQAQMQATLQSMFNSMMNHFSAFDRLAADNARGLPHQPFIIVPEDESSSPPTKKPRA